MLPRLLADVSARMPPSASGAWPLTKLEASLARNTAGPTRSFRGAPPRRRRLCDDELVERVVGCRPPWRSRSGLACCGVSMYVPRRCRCTGCCIRRTRWQCSSSASSGRPLQPHTRSPSRAPAQAEHRLLVLHHDVPRLAALAHHVKHHVVLRHFKMHIHFHPPLVGVRRHRVPRAVRLQHRHTHGKLARRQHVRVDELVDLSLVARFHQKLSDLYLCR